MKLHDFGSWWRLRYIDDGNKEYINVLDLSLLSIKEELYWFDQMSYTRADDRFYYRGKPCEIFYLFDGSVHLTWGLASRNSFTVGEIFNQRQVDLVNDSVVNGFFVHDIMYARFNQVVNETP
jgi:hypothetical protein